MTFFSLSDRAGITEVSLPPTEFDRYKHHVTKGNCVRVQGIMDRDGAEGRLRIQTLSSLSDMRVKMATGIEVNLTSEDIRNEERMKSLYSVLCRYRSDAPVGCRLWIRTEHPHGVEMKTQIFENSVFNVDPELFEEVEKITLRHNAIRIPGDGAPLEDPWFDEEPIDTEGVTA